MLGQIGLPGGGFGFGMRLKGLSAATIAVSIGHTSKGRNPHFAIPVAADMLLNPGLEIDDGQKITYPDTRLIWAEVIRSIIKTLID